MSTQPDPWGEDDAEVWVPPRSDCMEHRPDLPCPHCGGSMFHHRTRRCGDCGRRPRPYHQLTEQEGGPPNERIGEATCLDEVDACDCERECLCPSETAELEHAPAGLLDRVAAYLAVTCEDHGEPGHGVSAHREEARKLLFGAPGPRSETLRQSDELLAAGTSVTPAIPTRGDR